jgi:hypothetical protein
MNRDRYFYFDSDDIVKLGSINFVSELYIVMFHYAEKRFDHLKPLLVLVLD